MRMLSKKAGSIGPPETAATAEVTRDVLGVSFSTTRDGTEPAAVHDMIIHAVEKPMLDVVMKHADGNQSKAAEWLGINRNTLRRKLLDHKLIK